MQRHQNAPGAVSFPLFVLEIVWRAVWGIQQFISQLTPERPHAHCASNQLPWRQCMTAHGPLRMTIGWHLAICLCNERYGIMVWTCTLTSQSTSKPSHWVNEASARVRMEAGSYMIHISPLKSISQIISVNQPLGFSNLGFSSQFLFFQLKLKVG